MDDGSCIYCNINDSVFNYAGSIQTYTVPAGVTSVTIEAYGAQGGNGGGLGAEISGTFNVIPNQVLNILVGGEGGTRTNNLGVGGGGGGSFIWDQSNNLFIASGGGGGRAGNTQGGYPGAGSADIYPTNSVSAAGNGIGGNGGNGGSHGVFSE